MENSFCIFVSEEESTKTPKETTAIKPEANNENVVKAEPSGDGSSQKQTPSFKLLNKLALLHTSALQRDRSHTALLHDIGSHRRALCARRDLRIRRHLCGIQDVRI